MTPRRNLVRAASVLVACVVGGAAGAARSAGPAPPPAAAVEWKDAPRMTPEELVALLRAPGGEKPVLLHVGFRVLYSQAHIPGSRFAGPGRDEAGLAMLRKAVAPLAKAKPIVLYCGCCPWQHCPNMEPAWRTLRNAGFTNVKVLHIPQNLGADWVKKGYPVESGDAD